MCLMTWTLPSSSISARVAGHLGTVSCAAMGMSLYPHQSDVYADPQSSIRSAPVTPMAVKSLTAKIAVGGGLSASNFSAASCPVAVSKVELTTYSSGAIGRRPINRAELVQVGSARGSSGVRR